MATSQKYYFYSGTNNTLSKNLKKSWRIDDTVDTKWLVSTSVVVSEEINYFLCNGQCINIVCVLYTAASTIAIEYLNTIFEITKKLIFSHLLQ